MENIRLNNVSVGFPILHVAHRSAKKSILATLTGGAIVREARQPPFVRALHNISAVFKSGDRVGLVGPNGAGKTTLLRTIAGIYEPISGSIDVHGRVTTLLDVAVGFNPDMTGRQNIAMRGLYAGMSRDEIETFTPEIEAFTELGEYLDMPIRTYSSGMQLRLAFAIVTSARPDILLMDEWVLAGDASFMAKAQARMEEFVSRSSILILASHSEEVLRRWCNKGLYLQNGEVLKSNHIADVLDAYRHTATG